MKSLLKFQITKFMLLILLLILVNSPLLLKAKKINQRNISQERNSDIVVPLPEEAFAGEIEINNKSSNNITLNKSIPEEKEKKKENYKIKEYEIRQGETKLVIISNLGLNHIKTNIKHPYVYTASDVNINVNGYNIYVNATNKEKPIDLFIEAPNGNVYSLTLIPKQVPPQSLYFKAVDYTEDKIAETRKLLKNSSNKAIFPINYQYVEYVKTIIRKMALNKDIQGFIKEDTGKEDRNSLVLNDLKSILVSRYIGSNLIGEIWRIKNIGLTPVKISPKDFYSNNVVAVALELRNNLKFRNLLPNESCLIYIVKKIEEENE